jgi:hypothetical protein
MANVHENQIVEEFQMRRRKSLLSYGICILLIAFSLVLMQVADSYPALFGMYKRTWLSLAVAQLVAGVIFAIRGFTQYRCPSCNEIIKGHDKYYLGVLIDPEKCPNCNARLK